MRHNYIGGSSATGGTGALTLAAFRGLALPSAACVDGQAVEYSIVEYTDSTLTTVSKAESGCGTVSSNTLATRNPVETLNAGVIVQTGATALSFGTSNVVVQITPTAQGGPTSFPARANFAGVYGYGPNDYIIGANLVTPTDYSAIIMEANMLYMVPTRIESGFAPTVMGVSVTGAASGKVLSACIASTDPATGLPGVALQVVSGLSMSATGVITATVAGRLHAPAWGWTCFSSDGTPTILGSDGVGASPFGGFGTSSARTIRFAKRTRAHANFTVGTSVLAGSSGSPGGSANVSAPLLMWK